MAPYSRENLEDMPVTLAQARHLNAASDIDRNIIDEFRKSSFLLNALPFDQSVNPAGGGSTLTYGYTRQVTQRGAAFRAINAEYTPTEVTKAQYTVGLKPLGGSFQIDRVLTGIGAVSEVSFQLAQLIKATRAYFADQVINGDSAVTTDGFDGLRRPSATRPPRSRAPSSTWPPSTRRPSRSRPSAASTPGSRSWTVGPTPCS